MIFFLYFYAHRPFFQQLAKRFAVTLAEISAKIFFNVLILIPKSYAILLKIPPLKNCRLERPAPLMPSPETSAGLPVSSRIPRSPVDHNLKTSGLINIMSSMLRWLGGRRSESRALGNDQIIGNESVSQTENEIAIHLAILNYVVCYCMCVCEVLLQLSNI